MSIEKRQLSTSELQQLSKDLLKTGWLMEEIAGGEMGSAVMYGLTHKGDLMYLIVTPKGGGDVIYAMGESPVVRDSLVR